MSPPRPPLQPSLQSLIRCFQGMVPSNIATCQPDGTPNITFLSHVHYVDPTHVALSCQFFNKTRRNVEVNPHASIFVFDPVTLEGYRLEVRYTHSETTGPLYEAMALRIQAIASVTGMEGIFRLISADVYEVLAIDPAGDMLEPATPPAAGGQGTPEFALRQVLGVQVVSQQINGARDLDEMLEVLLTSLDECCGFAHAMMMVPVESGPGPPQRLQAIASRGYGAAGPRGIGAEVAVGDGFIGAVAEQLRVLRVSAVEGELRYGRAIRERIQSAGGTRLTPEIPLPGLPDARSHLALPLVVQDRLVGVLALESRDPLAFGTWDEALLQILANQIAIAMDRTSGCDEAEAGEAARRAGPADAGPPAPPPVARELRRRFTFFRNDDCVFVDDEYLIRNVPGKILWKLLTAFAREGRTEFSNRELRLDTTLGLPPVKSNLESRLILLRKRLEQKCPDVRLISTRRGRFAMEVKCEMELVEKDSA